MKIGILTQPLYSNYGGLLQAWALQKTLVEMGHEVIIINRIFGNPKLSFWRKLIKKIKSELIILFRKRNRYIQVTDSIIKLAETYIQSFKKKRYLGISPEIKSNEELLEYIKKEDFEAYIVGSDQVWRPRYSPNLMTYFLDFIKDNSKVKKISYAASFGVDKWEFSKKQTEEARELASIFDLITVRESSGVDLVEQYLKCKAIHVLDPTLLLSKEDYLELIKKPTCKLHESNGDLFCYVLDQGSSLSKIINTCKEATGLTPFFCNYEIPFNRLEMEADKEKCIVPPVEQWLKSFADATMIITDSFHGTVFSIIFNKPFWIISNEDRGAARFKSLLRLFKLENRIVDDVSNINWSQHIDWNFVNNQRQLLSKESIQPLFEIINKQ